MQQREADVDNSDDNYSGTDNSEISAENRDTVLGCRATDIQSSS